MTSESPEERDAFRERLGRALGDALELERDLGGGGMARVFVARDRRLGRSVAIKVLRPALAAGLSATRFEREVRFAARLQHPHIVPLLSAGEVDGLPYYTMPFIEGESLLDRLRRDGAFPVGDAVRVLRDLADALAYAHGEGIVHRDLKPANVLVSHGHAVIADFGIAKAVVAASREGTSATGTGGSSSNLAGTATSTALGVAVGTPAYMAPEQVAADPALDQRADLYALGLIAYEALTGAHPFAGYDARAMLAAHLTEPPPPLTDRRADVPPPLAGLVMRLLAKDPEARPRSAAAVLQELDELATTTQGGRTASTTPPRAARVRRSVVVASAVTLLLALGVAAYVVAHRANAASGRTAGTNARAVAVLPFVNTSGDPQDDYFGDGLTDELAHALAHLPGLRLAGRSSSYAFKGKSISATEIGHTLGVSEIVEGSVRRAGERVRVTMQLVSATDGTVLWDSVYESRSRDVFAVQDSLTHAVVAALAPTLGSGTNGTENVSRGTRDAEAYDLYLKGRYYWHERGAANVARSIDYFQRAIARDPTFARAYAALALAYEVLPVYVPDPTDSITPLLVSSARRAATLDSTLADAQTAVAIAFERSLRYPDAEAHFRAALALEPSNEFAHHVLGELLLSLGRVDDAITELHQATQLDPLAKSAGAALAEALIHARRFHESETESRRVLAIDSIFPLALFSLGWALAFDGQADSAVRTLERGVRLNPEQRRTQALLIFAYAAAGRWDDAARMRRRVRQAGGEPASDALSAFADLAFGNREPLVHLLTTRAGQLRWFDEFYGPGCNPMIDPLWTDQRFRAAMHDLGVRPCVLARPWPIRPRGPGGRAAGFAPG